MSATFLPLRKVDAKPTHGWGTMAVDGLVKGLPCRHAACGHGVVAAFALIRKGNRSLWSMVRCQGRLEVMFFGSLWKIVAPLAILTEKCGCGASTEHK